MPRRHHESQTAVLVQTTVHLNRVNMVASAWINGLITSVNVLLGIWAEIARKVLTHAAVHILTFTGTITAWHIYCKNFCHSSSELNVIQVSQSTG